MDDDMDETPVMTWAAPHTDIIKQMQQRKTKQETTVDDAKHTTEVGTDHAMPVDSVEETSAVKDPTAMGILAVYGGGGTRGVGKRGTVDGAVCVD